MTTYTRVGWLAFVLGLFAAPRFANAQLAPSGAQYAGRASDTGFSGPSDSGGYSTSVPLDLPPSRGGLPIPLQVVSGSARYGAVGVGWDLSLSALALHLSSGAALDPQEAEAWMTSDEGKAFMTLSSQEWCEANIAAGTAEADAHAAAERTTAFYTGSS